MNEHITNLEIRLDEVDNSEDWELLQARIDELSEYAKILRIVLATQSRGPRYYQRVLELREVLPGAENLCEFMLAATSGTGCKGLEIYELSLSVPWSIIYHCLTMEDPDLIFKHWDIIHGTCGTSWSLFALDSFQGAHVIFLGELLNIHPRVFISNMWRTFHDRPLDFGLPMAETPAAPIYVPSAGDPNIAILRDLRPSADCSPLALCSQRFSEPVSTLCADGVESIRLTLPCTLNDHFHRTVCEAEVASFAGRRVSDALYWNEVTTHRLSVEP